MDSHAVAMLEYLNKGYMMLNKLKDLWGEMNTCVDTPFEMLQALLGFIVYYIGGHLFLAFFIWACFHDLGRFLSWLSS
jgi:hypothetical protein